MKHVSTAPLASESTSATTNLQIHRKNGETLRCRTQSTAFKQLMSSFVPRIARIVNLRRPFVIPISSLPPCLPSRRHRSAGKRLTTAKLRSPLESGKRLRHRGRLRSSPTNSAFNVSLATGAAGFSLLILQRLLAFAPLSRAVYAPSPASALSSA